MIKADTWGTPRPMSGGRTPSPPTAPGSPPCCGAGAACCCPRRVARGEADLRVNGPKLQLTTIPPEEWAQVEAAAEKFWEEVASESETKAKVVEIFKKYNATMVKAGAPYRY